MVLSRHSIFLKHIINEFIVCKLRHLTNFEWEWQRRCTNVVVLDEHNINIVNMCIGRTNVQVVASVLDINQSQRTASVHAL